MKTTETKLVQVRSFFFWCHFLSWLLYLSVTHFLFPVLHNGWKKK